MAKTASVRARITPKLKHRAEKVLHDLGLSPTQAITMFYRQIELRRGLPFGVVMPNRTTSKTFQDTDNGRNLIMCRDAEDMFRKLGM